MTFPICYERRMLTVTVNDSPKILSEPQTLEKTLPDWGYQGERFAVALNGEFIPCQDYPQTLLHDGDQIVIFSPIHGG